MNQRLRDLCTGSPHQLRYKMIFCRSTFLPKLKWSEQAALPALVSCLICVRVYAAALLMVKFEDGTEKKRAATC